MIVGVVDYKIYILEITRLLLVDYLCMGKNYRGICIAYGTKVNVLVIRATNAFVSAHQKQINEVTSS
jgi:hypothetical protein